MRYIDFNTVDVGVKLAQITSESTWASEVVTNKKLPIRTAGRLFRTSRHGLQSFALLQALCGISRAQADALTAPGQTKPRVLVCSTDGVFINCLRGLISQKRGLQKGESHELCYQLDRFHVTLDEGSNSSMIALRNWAFRLLCDKELRNNLPDYLGPEVVSELVTVS